MRLLVHQCRRLIAIGLSTHALECTRTKAPARVRSLGYPVLPTRENEASSHTHTSQARRHAILKDIDPAPSYWATSFQLIAKLLGLGVRPAKGLQILHLQKRILESLIKCCASILYDVSFGDLTSDIYLVKEESATLFDVEDICTAFVHTAVRAPYYAQDGLGLSRLRALVSSISNNAKDHV